MYTAAIQHTYYNMTFTVSWAILSYHALLTKPILFCPDAERERSECVDI